MAGSLIAAPRFRNAMGRECGAFGRSPPDGHMAQLPYVTAQSSEAVKGPFERKEGQMRTLQLIAAMAGTLLLTVPATAGSPKGNIVAAASSSPDFQTLVTAVKAAKLTSTLASKGPFTVFAPTNDAFAKLPAGTVESLLQPENREQLAKVLTYHVVPGTYTANTILQAINSGGGQATLTTIEGSQLTAKLQDGKVVLVDEQNRTSVVTQTDLMQSNGIIHVIDTVLLPN
jgi:uncharacterized surface protein with fasciclin (FAS1) repeats